MDSGGNNSSKMPPSPATPRPHWRRRDSPTTVFVVHPSEFRQVVQRLTGAPPGSVRPPTTTHDSSGTTHAAAGGGAPTTLGQLHEEYMALAASDTIVLSPGRGEGGDDGGGAAGSEGSCRQGGPAR